MEYVVVRSYPFVVGYVRLNGDVHTLDVEAINHFEAVVTARKLLQHRYGGAPSKFAVMGPKGEKDPFGMQVIFGKGQVILAEFV